jgi:hypothetical protein
MAERASEALLPYLTHPSSAFEKGLIFTLRPDEQLDCYKAPMV